MLVNLSIMIMTCHNSLFVFLVNALTVLLRSEELGWNSVKRQISMKKCLKSHNLQNALSSCKIGCGGRDGDSQCGSS